MRRSIGLIALIGCGGGKEEGGPQEPGGAPDIEVDRAALDFGEREVVSGVSWTEVLTITNAGDADLHLASAEISGDDRGTFSLSAVTAVVLPPGIAATLTVTYQPALDGADDATLVIAADDPDEPRLEIALTGAGLAPALAVDPASPDFGEVAVGCDAAQPLTLSNAGSLDLVIDELSFRGEGVFSLDIPDADPLPWTIPPGASRGVTLAYAPLSGTADAATLIVASNDPGGERAVPLAGLGKSLGANTDVFEVPYEDRIAVLFAADKSCSMDDDLWGIATNFSSFVGALGVSGAEYRVAAVLQDDGEVCGSEDYIDGGNAAGAFEIAADMLGFVAPCAAGANAERAFELMEAGLAANAAWITAEGGWEESRLHLVGVSDEAEQSEEPWDEYLADFRSLRDDPDNVVIHAIGGDYPSGCGAAAPYDGMYEAVAATGGSFLSICSPDWAATLQELAEAIAPEQPDYDLTERPLPETIAVTVDGVPLASGWLYNSADNAVVFDAPSAPGGGAIIEVSYELWRECKN